MTINLCIYKVHDRWFISANALLSIGRLVTIYLHYFVMHGNTRFIKEYLIHTSNSKCFSCNHIETKKLDTIKNLLVGHLPMISYVYEWAFVWMEKAPEVYLF